MKLLGGFFFALGILLVLFAAFGGGVVLFVAGLVFGILGMVLAAAGQSLDKDKRGRHPCPHCREMIKRDATTCPFCRSNLQSESSDRAQALKPSEPPVPTAEPSSSVAKRERLKETLDKFREGGKAAS